MKSHSRFIVQFVIQLALIFLVLIVLLFLFFAVIGYTSTQQRLYQDLAKADSFFLSGKIAIEDGKAIIHQDLQKLADLHKGWLIVLNQSGEVLGSYHVPRDLPNRLSLNEIAALLHPMQPSAEQYNYWEVNDSRAGTIFVLYGRYHQPSILLSHTLQDIRWEQGVLNLSEDTLKKYEEFDGWAQLMDAAGIVIDQIGSDEISRYSIQELIRMESSEFIKIYVHQPSDKLLIVGTDQGKTIAQSQGSIPLRLIAAYAVILLLLAGGILWYARKFGVPVITIMSWIQQLGKGIYEMPVDRQYRSVFYNKQGKLKRKYRLYEDLIATLTQLMDALKQNEKQRKLSAKTRDEWISGLSHDLKTPLAAISGYAAMLESKVYSWTEEETREFASVIAEKSSYMKELLEDLTLTYRLQNDEFPIAKEPVDINEYIRRIIIHFVNDPTYQDKTFLFRQWNDTLIAEIDLKWFQRIMDNLIANAAKYNPPGTTITVTLSLIERHLITITIADNGNGMDEETLSKLFQRYYRGTNTADTSSGTGLGMAITKQLVYLHNGSISVNSSVGAGTSVRIILPIK